MTARARLRDFILAYGIEEATGVCQSDTARMAAVCNSVQSRLLTCKETSDAGPYGSYAEMAFNVSQSNPFLTMPRGVARLIRLDTCDRPVRIENQFAEYLEFGSGHWPKLACSNTNNVCMTGPNKAFRRNLVSTFTDLTVPGYGLRIYPGDPADANLSVITGAADSNGQTVFTLDGPVQIRGIKTTLGLPFVDVKLPGTSAMLELSAIDNIQKDITLGPGSFYQVNLSTGAQSLILTMEPGETVAAYSRYYLNALPKNCCNPVSNQPDIVQVKAMVKLDLVPVTVESDYLLIQSIPALLAEAACARLELSDNSDAKQQAAERHRAAIRYLQGQLVHMEGREDVAISFSPFGNARLAYQKVGSLQ